MNRMETADLLEKIQAYRQSFLITPKIINEWFRVLEPYDYEDVNQKLDDFFKNGDNFGRYPDVYFLIKYLKRIDEKLKTGISYINCSICQKEVDYTQFDKHYGRCSSIDYICKMSEKYFNKKLNREKMYLATEKEFDDYYWKFCKKLLEILPEGLERHTLKNSILSHGGYEIECNLNEISKELIK